MGQSAPPRLSPDQFYRSMSGVAEFRRSLIADPEFQLIHLSHVAGGFKVDGLSVHGVVVQYSSSARYSVDSDGKHYEARVGAGMNWVRPAGAAAAWSWRAPIEVLNLWIEPALWARVLRDVAPGGAIDLAPCFVGVDPVVDQVARALKDGAELGQPFGRLFRDSLLAGLIAHIADQSTHRKLPRAPRGGLVDWRLRRVLEHIEDHLADDISLAELAVLAGLSEHHFGTAFRKAMGAPPHRYLVERRIARAKSLFKGNRALSVIEVATAVGFTSTTHFATMFRKTTGGTPTAFRDS